MNNSEPDFSKELDNITTSYARLQVVCMLMQHEGCNRIRNNDSEGGLIILESVRSMRDTLAKQKDGVLDSFTEEEFEESYKRSGAERLLYSSVSDTALKDNSIYFDLGPRPAGDAYKCDEIACKAKTYTLAKEYFPSLYGKSAA